jgi:hypothetical protein
MSAWQPKTEKLNKQCFLFWWCRIFHLVCPRVTYAKLIKKNCKKQLAGGKKGKKEKQKGEARHRKYKRLKLGGGHVYNCSSV